MNSSLLKGIFKKELGNDVRRGKLKEKDDDSSTENTLNLLSIPSSVRICLFFFEGIKL